ncbi:hypothetical protein [Pseudomonas sp. OA65]|uniref:hypothetical protein n=1 Tax=Pseudomonas sp. OA65 TaxID=2818431 RepID=UPI001A9CE2CC|nr:hypothetical protein [Pseudomonas sp. OA65]MBO1542140.1 hypothetical protein [Pseudomonas sp. OA65]
MEVTTRKFFRWKTRFRGRHIQVVSRFLLPWLVHLALALVLVRPSQASAQADAPPRNYLDLGPHFVVAPGVGSSSEFRDILLQKSASARMAASANYRGWSLSGTLDKSIESTETHASELLATYSHKLPYVDVHLGIAHAQIEGDYSEECTSASLTASSNNFSSTNLDVTVQNDLADNCRFFAAGASQMLWQRGIHQIFFRASASSWTTDTLEADGWSVRLMGRSKIDENQSFHYHIGYIDSDLNRDSLKSRPSGSTIGINYVWEFR